MDYSVDFQYLNNIEQLESLISVIVCCSQPNQGFKSIHLIVIVQGFNGDI